MTKGSDQDERFDNDKEFKRIHDRFHQGHCLVTIATGDISDAEAERAGLVPTHAYALLDIRDVKVYKPRKEQSINLVIVRTLKYNYSKLRL